MDAPEPLAYRGPIHYTSINQETWYSVTMTGIVSESSVVFLAPTLTEKRGKVSCPWQQFSRSLLLSNRCIVLGSEKKMTLSRIAFIVKNGSDARITNHLEQEF